MEGQKHGTLAAAFSRLRFSPLWTEALVGEDISERERVAVTVRAIHALVKSLRLVEFEREMGLRGRSCV